MADPIKPDVILKEQVVKAFTEILSYRAEQHQVEQDQPLTKADIITIDKLPKYSYTTTQADTSSYSVSSSAPVAGYTRYYTTTHTKYKKSDLSDICPSLHHHIHWDIEGRYKQDWDNAFLLAKPFTSRPSSSSITLGDRQATDAHNVGVQQYSAQLNTGFKWMNEMVVGAMAEDPKLPRSQVVDSVVKLGLAFYHPDRKQISQLTEADIISLKLEVDWSGSKRQLRRIGDRWSFLQNTKYQSSTQPQYWIIDGDENHYSDSTSYDPDVTKYILLLNKGLEKFKAAKI